MEVNLAERRRSTRTAVSDGTVVVQGVALSVRLLDISTDGVLMGCPYPARLGPAPRLVARLGGRLVEADVEVRHVSSTSDPQDGGYRIGARFVKLEPDDRLAIDGFLTGSKV